MDMMTNLFSMFDPSTYYKTMAWWMLLIPAITLKQKAMKNMKKSTKILMKMKSNITSEIEETNKSNSKKGSSQTMSSMFMLLMMVNMMAIMPFNFTPTAHMSVSMTMSVMMWVSTMINASTNSTKKMMIHLTPMGTPTPLMNFMVMIETISNIIRPITLAVRLTANMVAGHLLLSMLSNFSMMNSMSVTMSSIPVMALTTLEMAVAMIQAYVFTTLVCLYYSESF